MSFNIDDVVTYAICPARALLDREVEVKPVRYTVRHRLKLAVNDLTIRALDTQDVPDQNVQRVIGRIFDGLDYSDRDKDQAAVTATLMNLGNLLKTYEMVITGSVVPFEVTYGHHILKSAIDFTAKDLSRGYIHPVIVDLSKTRYEVFYNPILYKCHTVAKHMSIIGSNTDVVVLTVDSTRDANKRWTYEKKKYQNLLDASITEMLDTMEDDRWPVRLGWWCAGCHYRGICHRLLEKMR